MKIINMHLDDFGIYHNVSWQPPESGLIVMHGNNESGKTTLMKYVRSMFFGYLRGDWRGYFGHMDIRREDGHEYTIYRNEKESYLTDGDEKILEEPADLWWHSLDRQTYDKIFAMGLEDLQGFKILSNEEVRSHFFSMESGVRIGMTRQDLAKTMGELLVASSQGKKPINALLNEQKEFDAKIRGLAYDEQEFADLQTKERSTHEVENRIRLEIEETKQQIERISMPIAAWDVYKRGQDALKQMQTLADVAQFPVDGAQQWSELETQIKDINRQIKALEETARTGPAFQEEWKRWLVDGQSLDDMYQHVMPWKQGLEELAAHKDEEMDWQFEQNKHVESLKPYLEGEAVPETVDWQRGISLADDLQRYTQELEKWQASKPKNVSSLPDTDGEEPERTQAEWEAIGKAVADIQNTLMERQKVQEQLAWLENEPVNSSHGFLYLSILFFIGAAALLWLVFDQNFDLAIGIGGAVACAVVGVICYIKQGVGADRVPKKIDELQGQLAVIQARLEDGAEGAKIDLSVTESNAVWSKKLDEVRKAYLDWKTAESKNAWEKEQKVMYDALYGKWEAAGKSWKDKMQACQAAWKAWQQTTGFTKVKASDAKTVKEIWDAWQTVTATLTQWQQRKETLVRQITVWHDTAEQLFREVGVTLPSTPENAEKVYKQDKMQACQAAWKAWQQTTGFTKVKASDAKTVKEIWDAWQTVTATLTQWQQRKETLVRQITVWHDTAEQLFREVGVTLPSTPENAEKVYKQWQDIRVQAEVAKEQDKQESQRRDQIAQLKRDRDMKEQNQHLLLTKTGAQTAGEFRSKLLKFRQFQQYKEVFDQSEAHLRLIAKNPKNLVELRHELKIHNIKNWTEEREYYEKKIADAEKKRNEVAEKRGSIIERLSQMAKSNEYSKLLQEKQNRKAELDTKVNDWLTYVFAQYMLGEAQTYYEKVRQPVVIRTASEYLHRMTQGRYTLQASFDGKELYAVDSSQRRIPEKQWSSGLGDQVYLAIRISLAVAFSKQIEPMPIILDDILVRFDEQRQKEAVQFLASLGKKEQVFLFTCSKATRDIAAAVQQELAGETDTVHLYTISQGTIAEG